MQLSKYMESRDISAKEMASLLDISITSMNNYLAGRSMTPLDVAIEVKFITKGRVTPEDLLEEYRSNSGVMERMLKEWVDD